MPELDGAVDPEYLSVAQDLDYISRAWTDGVAADEIRRGSAILRRFLVDGGQGVLFRAWRHHGLEGQPTVVAPDLRAACGEDLSAIIVGVAGGGSVGGLSAANMILNRGATTPDPLPVEVGTTAERPWRLLDFVDAPALVVDGEIVTRREVVKYMANHLGGVHLSRRVRKTEEEMVRRIRTLKPTLKAVENPLSLDWLEFELLSIGQLLADAPDVGRLKRRIESSARA